MNRILIIESVEADREALKSYFSDKGYEVTTAATGVSGFRHIKDGSFDFYFLDMQLSDKSGMDVLSEAVKIEHVAPAIIIADAQSAKSAVEAVRIGAFDYVMKPFDMELVMLSVKRALRVSTLQGENALLKTQLKRKYDFPMLIGDAPRMRALFETVAKVADTDAAVLVTGEPGSGKESAARTLHYNSSRAQRPFLSVSCSSVPEDALDSELFGREKAISTAAGGFKAGRLDMAGGGTLFVDEVADMPIRLQSKLLRVLQDGEFERAGGTKPVRVDVRVVCSTAKDIEKMILEGDFREDLYYRINIITLRIPALRERKDDIPLLIAHFNKQFSERRNKPMLSIPQSVKDVLTAYNWPGNVRELENLIERLVLLSESGSVSMEDLPERFFHKETPGAAAKAAAPGDAGYRLPENGCDLNAVLDGMEKSLIKQAMDKTGGVKTKAAKLLRLNRTTLIEKIKKKGM